MTASASILTGLTLLAFMAGAASDAGARRIPNAIAVAVLVLAVVRSFASGGVASTGATLLLAAGMLLVLVIPWRAGLLGGGDVKFAAATAAAAGTGGLLRFAAATAIAGGAIAFWQWAAMPKEARRATNAALILTVAPGATGSGMRGAGLQSPLRRVPYGVAVAFGGAYALLSG